MILEAELGELTDEQGGETHKLGKTRSEAWEYPQPREGRRTESKKRPEVEQENWKSAVSKKPGKGNSLVA